MAKDVKINICTDDLEENEPFQFFPAENLSSGKVTGHKEKIHMTFSTHPSPARLSRAWDFLKVACLYQWFSTSLTLRPFNTILHVVVTPS